MFPPFPTMDNFCIRLTFVTTSLFCLLKLCSLDTPPFLEDPFFRANCDEVVQDFASKGYGDAQVLPDPEGSGTEICRISKETQSCCSRQMELQYSKEAGRSFHTDLHSTTSVLKTSLRNNAQYYRDSVMQLLDGAENSTKGLFSTLYSDIPLDKHHSLVTNLFLELQLYVQQYDVDVGASVERFYNDLFPLVFEHLLLNSSRVHSFHRDYKDCLMQIRLQIYPAPFGEFPRQMKERLGRSLVVARLFLGSLDLMYQALDRADNVTLNEDCANALTRLGYCSNCNGFVSVKPCHDFCLNVMHGCLVGVSDLEPVWDQFLDTMKHFVTTVSTIYNMEVIVPEVYNMIANSVKFSIENVRNFYPQVVDGRLCGPPKTMVRHGRGEESPLRTYQPAEINRVYIPVNKDPPPVIVNRMEEYISNLQASDDFFSGLGNTLCSKASLASTSAYDCWNGQAVAQYTKNVPDPMFHSQGDNPEVEQKLRTKPPELQHASDNLVMMQKLLHSRASVLGMVKDDYDRPEEPSFPVYRDPLNSYARYPVDDEESDWSGSGSGDGWNAIPPGWLVTQAPDDSAVYKPYDSDEDDDDDKGEIITYGGGGNKPNPHNMAAQTRVFLSLLLASIGFAHVLTRISY